jgi:probable F420-dependent oxidoreductase
MKYTLTLPVDQVDPPAEFCTAEAITQMAQAAEAAGFDAVHATEHPFPTRHGPDMGGHHAMDPFVCLAIAGAATKTIRLHTCALVLPYRNPFLTAKSIADLDVATGGRLMPGVVPGYLAGEFAALGVDLDERNALMDEALEAMVAAWTGEPVFMEGEGWKANGNFMRPLPAQRPHPPLWIGGNSLGAIRRVVRYGQGWMPFPVQPNESLAVRTAVIRTFDEMRARIALLREEADKAGRKDHIDIGTCCFSHQHHPRGAENYDPPAFLEEVERMAEIGVTWISVKARSPNRKAFLENIARWGEEVISKARTREAVTA